MKVATNRKAQIASAQLQSNYSCSPESSAANTDALQLDVNYSSSLINYPGSKYTCSAFKKIINQFWPHDAFISGFLGRCAVMQEKQPALIRDYGIEIEESICKKYWPSNSNQTIFNADFIDTFVKDIPNPHKYAKHIKDEIAKSFTLLYLDPPYLLTARRNHKPIYKNELSDKDHIALLEWCLKQRCMIAISHYPCDLYDKILKDWRKINYKINTHRGVMVESLYMNYPEPDQLHEYTYLGNNKVERQQLQRKIQRQIQDIEKRPALERNAILSAINSHFNINK